MNIVFISISNIYILKIQVQADIGLAELGKYVNKLEKLICAPVYCVLRDCVYCLN